MKLFTRPVTSPTFDYVLLFVVGTLGVWYALSRSGVEAKVSWGMLAVVNLVNGWRLRRKTLALAKKKLES